MQPDRFGQLIPHPPPPLTVALGARLDPVTRQPQPPPHRVRIGVTPMVGGPQYAVQRCWPSRCIARRSRNSAAHWRSTRRRTTESLTSSSRPITDTGPSEVKFGALDLPRRRTTASPLIAAV